MKQLLQWGHIKVCCTGLSGIAAGLRRISLCTLSALLAPSEPSCRPPMSEPVPSSLLGPRPRTPVHCNRTLMLAWPPTTLVGLERMCIIVSLRGKGKEEIYKHTFSVSPSCSLSLSLSVQTWKASSFSQAWNHSEEWHFILNASYQKCGRHM